MRGASLVRGTDRCAAEYRVAVIEDRRLAWRDTAGWLAQCDPDCVAILVADGPMHLAVGTQLDKAVEWSSRSQAARPDRARRLDRNNPERLRRADGDSPRYRLDR